MCINRVGISIKVCLFLQPALFPQNAVKVGFTISGQWRRKWNFNKWLTFQLQSLRTYKEFLNNYFSNPIQNFYLITSIKSFLFLNPLLFTLFSNPRPSFTQTIVTRDCDSWALQSIRSCFKLLYGKRNFVFNL